MRLRPFGNICLFCLELTFWGQQDAYGWSLNVPMRWARLYGCGEKGDIRKVVRAINRVRSVTYDVLLEIIEETWQKLVYLS